MKKTIKDVALKGKCVLMRVDFNVPQDDKGSISDDTRIRAALPSIQYCLKQGVGKLILMSHLGRPDGKVVESLRLKPVARRLEALLGQKVEAIDDCIGDKVTSQIKSSPCTVMLLENLRFHPEEEKNDPAFAKALASLGDIFVNDAFGTAHRAHASTEGVAHYLESVAGFLMEKEINFLSRALKDAPRPYVLILGGAKVSDKIALVKNLMPRVDAMLIGGGMAYTFLKAQGHAIGNSKLEADKVDLAKGILQEAKEKGVKILFPEDHVVAVSPKEAGQVRVVTGDIPEGLMGLDIGPKTVEKFNQELASAKTVVWNGPLGVFEVDAFSKGSRAVAGFLAARKGVLTIIGGGDTASAINKFGLEDKMSHISTGGGASLEFLEGKVLPGVAILGEE